MRSKYQCPQRRSQNHSRNLSCLIKNPGNRGPLHQIVSMARGIMCHFMRDDSSQFRFVFGGFEHGEGVELCLSVGGDTCLLIPASFANLFHLRNRRLEFFACLQGHIAHPELDADLLEEVMGWRATGKDPHEIIADFLD